MDYNIQSSISSEVSIFPNSVLIIIKIINCMRKKIFWGNLGYWRHKETQIRQGSCS